MIAAPLSTALMKHFAGPASVGVAETFLVLGPLYFVAMAAGALAFRLPPPGWAPKGYVAPAVTSQRAAGPDLHPRDALRTRQFWLLWWVLCLNVTAGIGVLGQASAMIQEVFRGRIDAGAAAGFVGLLSLFNMGGRFFWSSLSDRIGRKSTYAVFFGLGAALYASVPLTESSGQVAPFVAAFAVILTMYGGGFATIPAYLSDLFGTRYVGAIHGRLLTAWSAAGVLGPVLVNYIRQYEIDRGVATAQAYNVTLYLMVGLLAVGFLCNALVRPLSATPAVSAPARPPAEGPMQPPGSGGRRETTGAAAAASRSGGEAQPPTPIIRLAAAWALVSIPLGWGVATTVSRAMALFRH